MKLPIASTVLLILFSQISVASSYPKPSRCPDVAAIQEVGVAYMEKETDFWYGAVDNVDYGTADNWNFGIGVFKTDDEDVAKRQAVAALKLLRSSSPGPIEFTDSWLCSYTDGQGHSAVAITPPMNSNRFLTMLNSSSY